MFITVKCYREEKFIGWLGTDNTYQYCLVDDISKADIYSISDKQNAENDAETYLYSNSTVILCMCICMYVICFSYYKLHENLFCLIFVSP